MIEFEIHHRTHNIGGRKGQTVYYAHPKAQQRVTYKDMVASIVRATSLSEGDVRNALISLKNEVIRALRQGQSIDLAELGSMKVIVPAKMMDSPGEVTAEKALRRPKILFTPREEMRQAADEVEIAIDHGSVVEALPSRTWKYKQQKQ